MCRKMALDRDRLGSKGGGLGLSFSWRSCQDMAAAACHATAGQTDKVAANNTTSSNMTNDSPRRDVTRVASKTSDSPSSPAHQCYVAVSQWPGILLLALGASLAALGVDHVVEAGGSLRLLALLGLSTQDKFPMEHVSIAAVLLAASLCAALTMASGGISVLEGGKWDGKAALLAALGKLFQLLCQLLLVKYLAATATVTVPESVITLDPILVSDSGPESSDCSKATEIEDEDISTNTFRSLSEETMTEEVVGTSGQDDNSIGSLVTDKDLATLIWRLEAPGGDHEDHRWEPVITKESDAVKYSVSRRDPLEGSATEYMSATEFSQCSVELLRDFYMDSSYACSWDALIRSHNHVATCETTGVEIGHFVKKYPLCSAREYVLASRLWTDGSGVFYCVTKAVEHHTVPRQSKLRRVDIYESMLRISSVPGTDRSEVKLYMREDNGMPKEIAKMGFKRGIWSYVKKMEQQIKQYALTVRTVPSLVTFSSVIPLEIYLRKPSMENRRPPATPSYFGTSTGGGCSMAGEASEDPTLAVSRRSVDNASSLENGSEESSCDRREEKEGEEKKTGSKPRRWLSSIVVLGGAMVLTNGAAPLGAKVVVACLIQSVIKPQKSFLP